MIIALIALLAVIGFVYWLMWQDEGRANRTVTVVNTVSLVYYAFIGLLITIAAITLLISGDVVLILFASILLAFIGIVASARYYNTKRAYAA